MLIPKGLTVKFWKRKTLFGNYVKDYFPISAILVEKSHLDQRKRELTIFNIFLSFFCNITVWKVSFSLFSFFLYFYLHLKTCLLILERGREGERTRNINMRNIDRLPLVHAPTGDQTCNLGMCPDQELNLQPSSLQDDAPTNWARPTRMWVYFLYQKISEIKWLC